MTAVRKAAPDVARAFGLRGLDPALALRTAGVRRTLDVERMSARERCKTFHAPCRKRKSGVKPPQSKASRHSHDAMREDASLTLALTFSPSFED